MKSKAFLLLLIAALSACATKTTTPPKAQDEFTVDPSRTQNGVASFYGGRWIGRKTANGEIYRASDMTAAHRRLPFGTRVRVTDEKTGRTTIVRINNRGPYSRGRIIDLSLAAANELGIRQRGVARVKVEVLKPVTTPAMRVARLQPRAGDAPKRRQGSGQALRGGTAPSG